MSTEERILIVAPPRPQSLFEVEREVHMLREICVMLLCEIVTLREKLAAERRNKSK